MTLHHQSPNSPPACWKLHTLKISNLGSRPTAGCVNTNSQPQAPQLICPTVHNLQKVLLTFTPLCTENLSFM